MLIACLICKNFSLSKDLGITKRDLKKNDKEYRKQIKAIEADRASLERVLKTWVDSTTLHKEHLRAAELKTAIATKKYEDLKNRPVVRYTDKQLDSVITVYTGYRR